MVYVHLEIYNNLHTQYLNVFILIKFANVLLYAIYLGLSFTVKKPAEEVCRADDVGNITFFKMDLFCQPTLLLWQGVCQSSLAGLWTASWSDSFC